MVEVEIAVAVDEQLDAVTDRLAHRAHPRGVLADHVHDGTRVAVAQRLVADRHLQPDETLRHPELGRCGQLLAVEEAEAERRIDRHARMRAAEQLPDRQAERLALDVPQRHVDRGERMRGIAGLAARHQHPVELVPDALVRKRIVADDRGPGDAVDDLRDHVLFGDAGQAVAGQAAVGLNLDMAAGERGLSCSHRPSRCAAAR